MAHSLARDLGVELEMVPFNFNTLYSALREGQLDIAMSCIASLPDRYSRAAFARPVFDLHMALIVPDYLRAELRQDESMLMKSASRW